LEKNNRICGVIIMEKTLLDKMELTPTMIFDTAIHGALKIDLMEQLEEHPSYYTLDISKYPFPTEFEEAWRNHPMECLQVLEPTLKEQAKLILNNPDAEPFLLIKDWKFMVKMPREFDSKDLLKLVTACGMITSSSRIEPLAIKTTYECENCERTFVIENKKLIKIAPKTCNLCGEGEPKEVSNTFIDTKILYIQDLPDKLMAGQNASTIRGLVHPVLTKEEYCIGQKLRITGYLEPYQLKKNMAIHEPVLNILNASKVEDDTLDTKTTKEEEEQIKELSKTPDIYEKLRSSIAPSLYDLDDVKEGLMLFLFSGVEQTLKDGTTKRGNIHLFLIGDPATAKSGLLTFIRNLMPRTIYAQGTGTSGVGLTATVTKDDLTNKWMIRPGAAVLANGGWLIIDELEKVRKKEDLDELDESLESGKATIHKADIHQTMPAQYSCLAAANPKKGRFDQFKNISEQIDVASPAFLSRFDLRFILKDRVDIERDTKLAKHIMGTLSGEVIQTDTLPKELLRKYVSYAIKNCKPTIPREIGELIVEKYVAIRHKEEAKDDKRVHLTPRQLEGFARMATASAKTRLSPVVEKIDVERAVNLFCKTLSDSGGDIDFAEGRPSADKRTKMEKVLEILQGTLDGTMPIDGLVNEAEKRGMDRIEVVHIIDGMKRNGLLYEPVSGLVGKL